MRGPRLAVAVFAAALATGGCSFGDDNGGGDGISREEYASQVDAICLDTQLAVEALPPPRSIAELGPYAERYAPLVERQAERLREVELPEGNEQAARQLIAEFEATANTWSAIAEAAQARQERRVQALLRDSQERTLAVRGLSQQLELQVCAPESF